MSFELYVGNYPLDFSRKDVLEIFKNFDGIKVLKSFKKEKKCYSFLLCKDIDQVVSVIKQKNNASVCGRKLIVRASDEKLQEYVELLLQEGSDKSKISQKSVDYADTTEPVNECHGANRKVPRVKSVDSPPFVPLQVLRNKVSKHQGDHAKDPYDQYDKNSSHSSCSSVGNPFNEHYDDDKNQFETASFKSGYHSNSLDQQDDNQFETASFKSGYHSNSLDQQDDVSEFTWVSVTNFPLGTSKRSLYQLFSDYEPVDIQMICNEARKDKTLTEAHVCFSNQNIADDVILNFDNTMFHGRILLVNDTKDLTVMNELLNVLHL